jgi:hypothetical protein
MYGPGLDVNVKFSLLGKCMTLTSNKKRKYIWTE